MAFIAVTDLQLIIGFLQDIPVKVITLATERE